MSCVVGSMKAGERDDDPQEYIKYDIHTAR
jgi:hypothetical protein